MLIYQHDSNKPQVNDTLLYILRREQQPTEPAKQWQGIIKRILIDINDRSQNYYYLVHSIDYVGETELVYPEQVMGYIANQGLAQSEQQQVTMNFG